MRYLFLIYEDEHAWERLSAVEREILDKACLTNNEALQQSGHLLAAGELPGRHTAVTVQIVNGKLSLTDGPAIKTQAPLIGFCLISARDLNEAILVASKMPQARRGPIEVRPCSSSG